MEDEERQKKLEAGKAKLAEYRQRKAYADSQKKQKKKKKKKSAEDPEGDSQERVEVCVGGEESSGGAQDASQEDRKDPPSSEFTFTGVLQSGETVKHHQKYTVEPESEVSTTAEDCSSEDEVEPLQQLKKAGTIQAMETELATKSKVVDELTQELEEIRAAYGKEGVQQLQDFEAALKQRDGIITQLTANLQQAREEKDEIMKEFLELTEQSQMLQIQFQQLQAGETLRNTSHSSTAADLLQARQQLSSYQQQVEELNAELIKHHDRGREQLQNIEQLQNKLEQTEMSGRKAEEFLTQRVDEKDQLIAEQEKVILSQEQSVTRLRLTEESFAQALKEKNQLISEQTAIIKQHEVSLTLLREEVVHVGRTSNQNIMHQSDEKDLIIAEQDRVISARDCSITQLEDELERSEKSLHELQQQMDAKETDLRKCLLELESSRSELEQCRTKIEKNELQRKTERMEFETCKAELATWRQKERMSSNEVMQLMGTIEDLQKRVHQGNLSESGTIQKMQDDSARKLEVLRAELDEMYGQQIVQMKQELNLQHAARVEQMTAQHHAELELLKENQLSQISAANAVGMETLNAKIHELQLESQAKHNKLRHELSQVSEEKINLQVKVEALLQDLDSAKEKVEQVSKSVISQESHRVELQRLQEIIEDLKGELALAQEEAQEVEAKHDSEITNYKIKLEMLEREKDAVLDRMAESQEAELERLRTQLLFSHEEELTSLREELQRENFLNTENLLNEAAVKHERVMDELRASCEEKLHVLENEKAGCVLEREELLHQIVELKEDLKIALHSSRADELVQQLQELQVELEELRKRGAKQAQMENEIQQLVKKTEVLEGESREKEKCWENKWREQEEEKGTLIESNSSLKEELVAKNLMIETLEADNIQAHQQLAELTDEIKKQKTTFSFAEKNFEVNYQELKEEYTCLVEAKAQLEERTLKETLEFEAKIARLHSQILELEGGSSRDTKTEGNGTTRLMEELNVTFSEKESLVRAISEAAQQLTLTRSRVKELEEQLSRLREENEAVAARNESLGKLLEEKQAIEKEQDVEPASAEEQQRQIKSLQEEIKALQCLLQAAESERDDIQQALEFQRLTLTPSPGAGPVEGKPSPRKSTAAGSSRRKRRQRSKQERRLATAASDCKEKQRTWEEEEEDEEEEAALEEERATSAAELQMQPRTESRVMSRSQERDGEADSTDGYQGDRDYISKPVRKHGMGHNMEEKETTTEHGECRLQMEAQRISLSQIHAAQLELLQEETEARTHSLELRLQRQSSQGGPAEPKLLQSINISQAVQKECTEIVENFHKIFGEKLLESVEAEGWKPPPSKRKDTSDSTSVLMEARELYRGLQQVRETIEQEHFRLLQLQSLLREDVNKMIELQTAYDTLQSSSEQQISALQLQIATLRSSTIKEAIEQTGTPPACLSEELQRLRAEDQLKQRKLEESHREEVECLRAHYQQQATETEERYLTELLMLQQQLQDVTDPHSSVTETDHESSKEHREELHKKLVEEELPGEGAELRSPVRSAGLATQLQALRTTLHRKYVQEVAALKEQHDRELRRLREEKEVDGKRGEKGGRAEELNDSHSPGCSGESSAAAGQNVQGKTQDWERIEEEVAKAIVQMSVQFAQQTELLRISKGACQKSTSMQTVQSGEDEMEEKENEELTPRASPSLSVRVEEVERLRRELEERNAVITMLKEELLKIKSGPEQRENGREEDLEVRDSEELERKEDSKGKETLHDSSGSTDSERNILLQANKSLSHVLVEVLKTTAAAEETLGLHMQSLSVSSGATLHMPDHTECYESSETTTEDADLWSREMKADESLMISHQTIESLLLGVGSQLENEDYLTGISCRLQTALEKMLMVITDTTNQLEHARLTQTELMRESFRHNQEINELLQKQDELQERLTEEARAREQLALELHRAEGLIDGYTGERAALEEQLHQKEELQLNLEQELQVTSSRLHELEQERLQMQEERELLSRQQDAMREHAGPRELRLVEAAMVAAPEADLLEETEKLMKEKVEVQRQAEKENAELLKHNKLLEAELEEQVSRLFELEQTQMTERRDLQQQIQALEKQLENNRKFLDEQAVDREHERDFFQQEIQKLEQQLKNQQKQQAGSEHRNQEVDRLTSQLKEKADWCSELLLSSEQLRRELQERDEEIDKLESRIRELEQALLASAESLEKNQHATITETEQSMLESQLQTEREALERKEKEICNLEEQLEQFKEELENKSEEVQQLHMQLEIQRKEISSQQEYLETRDSLLQVMEAKDREIALLNEQITKLQHTETTSDNKVLDGREEVIKDLESQVKCLRSEQERLKRNNEEEVDQMSAVIDKLQQELTNIEQKPVPEEDEDTRTELESLAWALNKEEYEEMKKRLDLATEELGTLKTERSKLQENYLGLKESTKALAETEELQSTDAELEDALIQKTAGLVVMQAQVQALEQSASSRLEELGLRVQELEDVVDEKECELRRCRLQLEQTQRHAEDVQQTASELEVNLRDKVAEAFAIQQQPERSKELQDRLSSAETQATPDVGPRGYDFSDIGIPRMDFSQIGQLGPLSTGKVFHLTQRLQELEVGLSGIQKDQELQKQLLSSSEEEVLEYERRLSVLMDLLRQMKTRTHQRASPALEVSTSGEPSEVQQELQEVRAEVLATTEELVSYKDTCSRLQEELQDKNVTMEKLKEQLEKVSLRVDEGGVSELKGELTEAQNEAAATKEELNSCRERLEKLQELLQEREMTIAHLTELCQVKTEQDIHSKTELPLEAGNDSASTKEDPESLRQHNEKLLEDLQLRDISVAELQEELQEMKAKLETTKEELASRRQHNEKLQEELHLHDVSISKLKEELQRTKEEVDATSDELDSKRHHNEKLLEDLQLREVSISKLTDELQEMREKLDATREPDSSRLRSEKLQEDLQLRDTSIAKLKEDLQEMRGKMDSTEGELDTSRQYSEKLEEDLHLRDVSVSKLEEELQKLRDSLNTTEEEFSIYKEDQGKLHDHLQACEGSMSKLEVELQEKRHNLESTEKELSIYKQHKENLQEELHACTGSLSQLREELEQMRLNLDSSQENLKSFRQQNEQLQEEVHLRERSISKLKEELQEAQRELVRAGDSVPPSPSPSPSPSASPLLLSSASSSSTAQPKRKGVKPASGKGSSAKDKAAVSRRTSSQASSKAHGTRLSSRSEQPAAAVTDSSTQTEHIPLSDLRPERKTHTDEEMEEVIADFRDKIVQMQELHAAEILDMEARHISESDSLRRDTQALEDECKALQAAIDKLRSPEVQSSRLDRPASLLRDDYTSDSSSDYSQRTGFDVPSLQQELRSTPEGARREPGDPLPDRIKTLLREVHQEGMQVLSLTELPVPEGDSGNIPSWVKERDDLLTTVESLKGLIAHMQMKTSGVEDWRAQLLDAVRRVFLSERDVLKSALYRQLDALDTSDAIVHLNQLERRLAEQDVQHREAMDSLRTADRASLVSEVHQLRRQLEHLHHSEATGHSLIETREGGAGGGGGGERVVESDRLLMEELKGELSQTKLELETTLKAQHKHLKELDTLRAEVSQKAAEVDALNDRLTEEKKRSRDLQWAVEKERCETGRNEESKREELEDLQLTLEEQRGLVAQLSVSLEEERRASSRLSEQAEEERLSLHRRLQELQVQLETERAKALEMGAALGRERELRTSVSSRSAPSGELEETEASQEGDSSLLGKLQRELDDKHAQVVHLLSQLEVQRLEVVQREEELTASRQKLRREQEVLQVARARLETLEAQLSESQEQLGRELEKSRSLEEEREQLEEKLRWLSERSGRREEAVSPADAAQDRLSQQKSGGARSPGASAAACGPWRTVDKILSKLYLISSKLSSMASRPASSSPAEVEQEDLAWVQSNVDDVITMLQQSPALPPVPESAALLAGGSSSTLTQRLLRQNAELTGFVSRLTEEKNDLRNQTLRLEEEIRRYRQAGLGTGDSFDFRRGLSKSDSSGTLLSQEREAWAREKARLERAFQQAQAQIAVLRGEIRSQTLREITGPEADNAALKRIYGKYLRSESFRKALIYQKKYLLLLLGGFQECEEATLALLSRMGVQPALSSLGSLSQRRRGLMRFRSAVRVSIALSRMRFLVRRWHRTTGISSPSGTSGKNGAGQMSGSDARDSPYLHPGSLETCRDRGGGASSGRGRSGRESPRSATSSTHHRFHLAGEHGALTCSHLQSYDPDRALTDYISRLEALQRRLGSVTSGATSHAQLHFGLRR